MALDLSNTDSLALPANSHRLDAPVWAFHRAVNDAVWLAQVARWWWTSEVLHVRGRDATVIAASFLVLFGAVIGIGVCR